MLGLSSPASLAFTSRCYKTALRRCKPVLGGSVFAYAVQPSISASPSSPHPPSPSLFFCLRICVRLLGRIFQSKRALHTNPYIGFTRMEHQQCLDKSRKENGSVGGERTCCVGYGVHGHHFEVLLTSARWS